MVLLEEEQALGFVWCCAKKVVNGTKKVVCPTEAMPYGMCTMFSFLLAKQLEEHEEGGASIVSSNYITIEVHASPSFGDTYPFPIPGLDCNINLSIKDLPSNCICFTISDREVNPPAARRPSVDDATKK
jgi:hypothetical protein